MKKKNKDQTTVKKIEFDANTNEPIVVEISEQEYLEQRAKTHSLSEKNDFVKMKSEKGTRSKMAVERTLGIKKEEATKLVKAKASKEDKTEDIIKKCL